MSVMAIEIALSLARRIFWYQSVFLIFGCCYCVCKFMSQLCCLLYLPQQLWWWWGDEGAV